MAGGDEGFSGEQGKEARREGGGRGEGVDNIISVVLNATGPTRGKLSTYLDIRGMCHRATMTNKCRLRVGLNNSHQLSSVAVRRHAPSGDHFTPAHSKIQG